MSDAHAGFRHLAAPEAAAYRAVLRTFAAAKDSFVLQLRPDEVHAQADPALRPSRTALDGVLTQMATWGNLLVTGDTSEVATLEDFYRARFLYQLSRHGEAAEEALAVFEERIARPGALQAAALADILDHLARLAQALGVEPVDAATVHQELSALMRGGA